MLFKNTVLLFVVLVLFAVSCSAAVEETEDKLVTVTAHPTTSTQSTKSFVKSDLTRVPTQAQNTGYITFWFDDALQSTYDVAYPALEERGWKAVLAVVADKDAAMDKFVPDGDPVMTWEAVQELANAGWEISSHSMTHPHLNKIRDKAFLEMEVLGSKEVLESRGLTVPSFTFPYGEQGGLLGQGFVDSKYLYWRSSLSGVNPVPAWRNLTAYFLTTEVTKPVLEGWVNEAEERSGWLIVGMHAILSEPSNKWQHTPKQFEMVLEVVENSSLGVVLPEEMFDRFGYAEGVVPELRESESDSQTLGMDGISIGDIYLEIPAIEVDNELGVACNKEGEENLDFSDLHEIPLWICSEASPYLEDIGSFGASLVIGHRQWGPEPKVFARLDELENGDVIRVGNDSSSELEFEVIGSEEVDPEQVWPAIADIHSNAQKGSKAVLILLTCTPYGTDRRRLLVYATL